MNGRVISEPVRLRPFAGYLANGDGPALCRAVCARLRPGGAGFGGRSTDGAALCRRYCRGFGAGLPMIVVRRSRADKGGR